jgi:hypothetical protein
MSKLRMQEVHGRARRQVICRARKAHPSGIRSRDLFL